MNCHLRGLAVTAGLLITTSAAAGVSPNGLMPNGLMPNGLMPNGLMPNGLMPNGLMPNGLMPNGLMPNGLMPNGLMPNGLMPNGLTSYVLYGGMHADVNGTDVSFDQWFAVDPVARDNFMKYFVRCAYDATTEVMYADAAGSLWQWQGGIGFAMTSLKAGLQMTVDEGRWISSCVLAFVNTKGTHQYISLRGNPPNPEAKAALAPSVNEQVFMADPFGVLFADLGTTGAYKAACRHGSLDNWAVAKVDLVLGRDCDVRQCTYLDPLGATVPILDMYWSGCTDSWNVSGTTPSLTFLPSFGAPDFDAVEVKDVPGPLRPLLTYGPVYRTSVPNAIPIYDGYTTVGWRATNFGFKDVARCAKDPRDLDYGLGYCSPADAPYTSAFDQQQVVECGQNACLGGSPYSTGGGASNPGARTFALVDLAYGQAGDWVSIWGRGTNPDGTTLVADLAEPVTALVRYSKERTASARVFASGAADGWADASGYGGGNGAADIFPGTGAGQWEYLQIYPVYVRPDEFVGASPGRYCATNQDCTAGLGLSCGNGTCWTTAISTTDASGQTTWSCGGAPGQLQILDHYGSATPECVEPCTSDAQCAAGGVCRSGRCANPVAKVRIAGAAMSESCTGAELFRGPNEQGSCSITPASYPKNNTECPKDKEVGTPCRGTLVWTKRQNAWGWYCRGGGEALYVCTADDSPVVDAVGFVPARPWCMAPEATTFLGVCK